MSESNALAIVKAAQEKGALVFANIENMEAKVDLYRTEVTEITFHESDFHNISGKYMPTKAAVDRIGEACGVQFIQSACRVTPETLDDELCGKRTVYRAETQGKVRMPDGSWRTSTVDEYEFDPTLRAMLDKNVTELNPQTKKAVGRAVMEYQKVGRQRAATGARVRVIRQLTGMPSSFTKEEILKPMVFTRIVQNTAYILNTPEGRAMATAQALGMDISALFGGRKPPNPAETLPEGHTGSITPGDSPPDTGAAALAAQAAGEGAEEPEFPGASEPETAPRKETEFERLTHILDEILTSYKAELDVVTSKGGHPYKMAAEELNNPGATEATRNDMVRRVMAFLKAKGVNV